LSSLRDCLLFCLCHSAVDDFFFFHGIAPLWCCATLWRKMAEIKTGFVVFATQDTPSGIADAREWLAKKAMKPDHVRLYRMDGQVLVETLKPVLIPSQ